MRRIVLALFIGIPFVVAGVTCTLCFTHWLREDGVSRNHGDVHNQGGTGTDTSHDPELHSGSSIAVMPARSDVSQLDDPSRDGWESEKISNEANAQLKRVGAVLVDAVSGKSEKTRASASSLINAEVFQCSRLRPALEEAFRDETLTVLRGVPATEEESSLFRGADGLASAISELVMPFSGMEDIRAKFKVVGVTLKGSSAETTVRAELAGYTKTNSAQQTATWICVWDAGNKPLVLLSIRLEDFEEVVANIPSRTILTDETNALLGSEKSYRNQLSIGSSDWLSRMDASLALQTFGHHGIAIGDVNGDDLEDIYVCQPAGLPNRLFTQDQDGTLTDISAMAGVDWLEPTYGALIVDLNNDGFQDLILAIDSDLMLMSNDGHGTFRRRTVLDVTRPAHSLTAGDFDLDGDLDIYACVYRSAHSKPGELAHPIPFNDANNGGRNVLWRNDHSVDSEWVFTDATEEVGLDDNNSRWSFAAAWEDYDNDGDSDLYVANDFGRNNLYRNDDGHFTDVARDAGVEDGSFGMSVAWADYNCDGLMDLYVSNMYSAAGNRVTYQRKFKEGHGETVNAKYRYLARGNSLFANAGDGTFRDVSLQSGTMMGRWAWGTKFVDLNNDGWEDILVANGWQTNSKPNDL